MKKKVKDLDPVLQKLIEEKVSIQFNKPDLYAEPLLEMIDWKLATNDERLKYAEWKYTNGTKFNGVGGTSFISSGKFKTQPEGELTNWIHNLDDNSHEFGTIYNAYTNKWAEIVSRPDEKEETQEPEFQPGEMVEVGCDHADWGENEWMQTEYFGFVNGKHACRMIGKGTHPNALFIYDRIRKIQPDPEKKLRDLAQIIMHGKYELSNPSFYHKDNVESMLIEALKTEIK